VLAVYDDNSGSSTSAQLSPITFSTQPTSSTWSPQPATTYTSTTAAGSAYAPQPSGSGQTSTSQVPATAYGAYGYNSDNIQRHFQGPPVERITDPVLIKNKAWASKKLLGTKYDYEPLDSRKSSLSRPLLQRDSNLAIGYKVRRPGRDFFRVGKVFKVLWPELAGDELVGQGNITVLSEKFAEERIFTKIRWFVVVREENNFCSCL
jgi:hypothetical protein